MDGTGELFSSFIQQFDNVIDCQIVRYPNDRALTYIQLTQWVTQQLPTEIPYYLLAESFSGPIGYAIATQKPKNLQGIIFVATFLAPPRQYLTTIAATLPWQMLKKFKAPDWFSRKFLLGPNAGEALIEQFWQIVDILPPELIKARLKQIAQSVIPNETIDVPCLYLGGNQDYLVPANNIENFQAQCSQLTVHTMDGPHFLLQAEPEACQQYIETFIDFQ